MSGQRSPIFITGTDTDVGKTYVTTRLLESFNRQGISAVGYKPIASGSEIIEGELRNPDAYALLNASDSTLNLQYEEVNPYFFEEANAPHLLSRKMDRSLDFSVMTSGAENLKSRSDQLIIEGAGGWFTPLSEKATFADWVIENQCPVIVVVGLKLGCINHALLTFREIERSGLNTLGWIANFLNEGDIDYKQKYIESITQLTSLPLIESIHYGQISAEFTPLIRS